MVDVQFMRIINEMRKPRVKIYLFKNEYFYIKMNILLYFTKVYNIYLGGYETRLPIPLLLLLLKLGVLYEF